MSEEILFISIVIPLYNKARHIEDTLKAVLSQTHQDFEIIVVDDGSTDGGGEIVSNFKDSRIKFIQQENGGVSKARNTGIEHSSYELIAFLDADDIWLPEHLETINRMATHFKDAGLYATSYIIRTAQYDRHLKTYGIPSGNFEGIVPDYFESVALGDNITWSSAVAVKKSVFQNVGMFPIGVRMGEDLDTWFRILLKYPICFSSKETAIYQWETDNRACATYRQSDLHSPLLTSWLHYETDGFKGTFMLNHQNHLIRSLIYSGFGKEVRPILVQMGKKYNFRSIIVNYILSYVDKQYLNVLRKIKNSVNRTNA